MVYSSFKAKKKFNPFGELIGQKAQPIEDNSPIKNAINTPQDIQPKAIRNTTGLDPQTEFRKPIITETGSQKKRFGQTGTEKTYNVQDYQGRNFPTTNPDFNPNLPKDTEKDITFKGDRVQVKAGDQTFDLSKDEYLGNFVTPKTMALDQALAAAPDLTSEQKTNIEQIGQAVNINDPLVGIENPDITGQLKKVGGAVAGGITGLRLGALLEAGIGIAGAPLTGGASLALVGATVGIGAAGGYILTSDYLKGGKVTAAETVYRSAKSNVGKILTEANNGGNYHQAIMAYNEQKQLIQLTKEHIKGLSTGNLGDYEKGKGLAIAIENWQKINEPIIERALARAAVNPDPNLTFNFQEPIDTAS